MELGKKELYCCPEAKIFEVEIQGVVCGSLQNYNWNDYEEE